MDIEVGNNKQSITPPIQKIIFEKCHRSSRSMSQLKNIKSSLGSSLDQGLDKPVQSLVLGSQSKRICKSEESAIDNKTLVLVKDRSTNSSNETLNNAILTNKYISDIDNEDNFQINEVAIENNIEIMIPTSVSKTINVMDSFEGSVSVRDRSSNSISSCEMALTSSQNGDDSSNDNNTKKDETRELISITNEISINVNDVVDNALKNGKYNEDYNLENQTSKDYDNLKILADKSCNDYEHTPATTEISTYNKEHFAKSCLSLDDIMCCAYEETEKKQRTSSICSYPEEYLSSKYLTSRKRYNSESK